MERWHLLSLRATFVLIVASVALIVPALLGAGATTQVAGGLVLISGALWLVRNLLAGLPTVVGYDLGWYARDCWIGTLLGAAIVLSFHGALAAELQALGGLAGLLGMVNYFVRPLYLYVGANLRRLVQGT